MAGQRNVAQQCTSTVAAKESLVTKLTFLDNHTQNLGVGHAQGCRHCLQLCTACVQVPHTFFSQPAIQLLVAQQMHT